MKISNLTAKTSLEVSDTDLLVIEDAEDTKSITIAEFKELLTNTTATKTKMLINETIDNVINALNDAKYITTKLLEYTVYVWIDDATGNIQLAFKLAEHWLSMEEINTLFSSPDNLPEFKIMIADAYAIPVSTSCHDFNTEYADALSKNQLLSEANGGFLVLHLEGYTQNEIAGITFDDIIITLNDREEYKYSFIVDEASFVNSVPYEEEL